MSMEAESLVKALLTRRPEDRLGSGPTGVQAIKHHPFFASVDWNAYLRREVEPPIKPKVEVRVFRKSRAYEMQSTQSLSLVKTGASPAICSRRSTCAE